MDLLLAYAEYIALGLVVLLLIMFIWMLTLSVKMKRIQKRYAAFMQGSNNGSLEGLLHQVIEEVNTMQGEVLASRKKMSVLNELLSSVVQGVGVVRFNAFQDTGSDLSFSVALLDSHKNGVVFSGIYGREETRTYAKPIEQGQSKYQLSVEEQEAIKKASATLIKAN